MQPRNPDWDNPNIPRPDQPNQGWGQQNPNIPNYDPNAQGQGWGQQNPNIQGQGWGQQQPPIQGQQQPTRAGVNLYAAPSGSPYSDDEWKLLMATPLRVCKAMMLVSPSGPIGVIQETKAMADSVKSLLSHDTSSQLLNDLRRSAERVMGAKQAADPKGVLSDLLGPSKDPTQCRTEALGDCQQIASVLRKASPQDAAEYKQFVYSCALRVAEAAREGGIMGIGGQQVSPQEQDLLRDVSNTLGIQRQ